MNADVENALKELFASIGELSEAKQNYIKAVATTKNNSEKLSTLLQYIIQQPQIEIDDYELDG